MRKILLTFCFALAGVLPQQSFALFNVPHLAPAQEDWATTHVSLEQRGSVFTAISLEQKDAELVIFPIRETEEAPRVTANNSDQKFYRLVFRSNTGSVSIIPLRKTNKATDTQNIFLQSSSKEPAYSMTVSGPQSSTLLLNMERLEAGVAIDRASLYLEPVINMANQ